MRSKAFAFISCALLFGISIAAAAFAQVRETERLDACRIVVMEVLGMPEGIPHELLDKAECVAIVPGVKKAAFGFGARFGKGAVMCRTEGGRGAWGPPLLITLGGGSFGLQIGGESADFVFLIMNPRGIDYLLRDKFTLGADVSVALGPKGRNLEAATDAQMHAEILTYSRSRGIFAGLSLEGAVVRQDVKANRAVYGEKVVPLELLTSPNQRVPAAARALVDSLRESSPEKVSQR